MRRLVLFAVAVSAAVSFGPSASANEDCRSDAYGVVVKDLEVGACAGTYCMDVCLIELGLYCHGEAPLAALCPAV